MSARLTAKVCQYYYRDQLTMAEIGERLGLSRHKVGRLLKEALANGTIRIEIRTPYAQANEAEERLEREFGLRSAVVVDVDGDASDDVIKTNTCAAGAEFLAALITGGPRMGIGWGSTTYELVRQFPSIPDAEATVVQITGGNKRLSAQFDCHEVTRGLAAKLGVEPVLLHAPGIVDKPETREALLQESAVLETFQLFDSIDIAIVGIGALVPETHSTLIESGYISQREVAALKKAGAIGDVFSYFIDDEGNVVRTDLYDRMVTIGIDQVRRVPYAIGVAVGAQKARAVAGAVRGGFVNALIVDKRLADQMLRNVERGQTRQDVRRETAAARLDLPRRMKCV